MIMVTKARKSKSKKQFQHGVRIGFSATIIPEVTMPRALSLAFSSSAEPVLQAVWSLSPLFGVHLPAPVKQLLLSSRHLFTASPCPQLHCNLARLPFCPSLSLSLSLSVQSLHRRVLVLLSLRATLPCCPVAILFGLITTHHHLEVLGLWLLASAVCLASFQAHPTVKGYFRASSGCPEHTSHPLIWH